MMGKAAECSNSNSATGWRLCFRGRSLEFRQRDVPRLMGILNVTPDSFADGGRHNGNVTQAVEHALQMCADGAEIIDIGGESTRPGATPVAAEEEMSRLLPVIAELRRRSDVPISVDTYKASVAAAALEAGADIVNDVTALGDPAMAAMVARFRAGCVLMAGKVGDGADAVSAVVRCLGDALHRAVMDTGLPMEHFAVDPGIGFGKGWRADLELLAHSEALQCLDVPVLLAFSRKSCIGAATGVEAPAERLPGTLAAAVMVRGKCQLLRVHDVAEVRQALKMASELDISGVR